MAKKETFEIYESLSKRKKKYVVLSENCKNATYEAALRYIMKINHCSAAHILATRGFILNGELYFDKPDNKKAKFVYVLTYSR